MLQYLLPLKLSDSSYGLLVVNRLRRRVVVMDPSFNTFDPEDSTHNILMRKEISLLKEELNNVLQARIPGWNTHIMDWGEDTIYSAGLR